jgi:hypothetical protein
MEEEQPQEPEPEHDYYGHYEPESQSLDQGVREGHGRNVHGHVLDQKGWDPERGLRVGDHGRSAHGLALGQDQEPLSDTESESPSSVSSSSSTSSSSSESSDDDDDDDEVSPSGRDHWHIANGPPNPSGSGTRALAERQSSGPNTSGSEKGPSLVGGRVWEDKPLTPEEEARRFAREAVTQGLQRSGRMVVLPPQAPPTPQVPEGSSHESFPRPVLPPPPSQHQPSERWSREKKKRRHHHRRRRSHSTSGRDHTRAANDPPNPPGSRVRPVSHGTAQTVGGGGGGFSWSHAHELQPENPFAARRLVSQNAPQPPGNNLPKIITRPMQLACFQPTTSVASPPPPPLSSAPAIWAPPPVPMSISSAPQHPAHTYGGGAAGGGWTSNPQSFVPPHAAWQHWGHTSNSDPAGQPQPQPHPQPHPQPQPSHPQISGGGYGPMYDQRHFAPASNEHDYGYDDYEQDGGGAGGQEPPSSSSKIRFKTPPRGKVAAGATPDVLLQMMMRQQEQMNALQQQLQGFQPPSTSGGGAKSKAGSSTHKRGGANGSPATAAAAHGATDEDGDKRTYRLYVWDARARHYAETKHRLSGREPGQAAKKAVQKGAQQFALVEKLDSPKIMVYFYVGDRVMISKTVQVAGKQFTSNSKALVRMWKKVPGEQRQLEEILRNFPPLPPPAGQQRR